MSEHKLTVIEHLEELRIRIIKSLVFLCITACFIYTLKSPVMENLAKPVGRLVFLSPQEAFVTDLKLALFGGLFFSSPFIIYQMWAFVEQALGESLKKFIGLAVFLSSLLFLGGCAFGYFVVVPVGVKFLMGYSTEFVIPMISVSKYISFVGVMSLVLGIVFELPLLIALLTKLNLVTPNYLSKNRKYAIVAIFIIGAVLTPPDIVSQCLLAIPLLILYEISIIFSRLIYKAS